MHESPERQGVVRVNQSMAHPVSKAMAQENCQNGTNTAMFDTETNSFSLPNPNGTHYTAQNQQHQTQYICGGKMRSKSHIRSDMNGNSVVEVNANVNNYAHSSHKKHF